MSGRHVLLFPSSYPASHAPVRGIFYREQAQALCEKAERVGVVYPDNRRLRTLRPSALLENRGQITVQREHGIPTVRWHGWNVPSEWLRGKMLTRQFRILFSRYVEAFGEPDVLHSHGVFWGGRGAQLVSNEKNIPFVHTEHSTGYARGLFDSWELGQIESVLSSSATTIAVSRSLAECIKEAVSVQEIRVVPNVVDTDHFTLPPTSRSEESFTFLSVARLKQKKNLDLLIRAFHRAFGGEKEIQLEIGGDGPQTEALRSLVAELGIGDQVSLLGKLSRTQVRERMWEANVFVLPSRVETFGVVVIEAMSTGLPVVATRSGGTEEIVTDETGWLVEPGEIGELAQALRQAHENRSATLGPRQIRKIAEDRYSRPAVSSNLLRVYDDVLGASQAATADEIITQE